MYCITGNGSEEDGTGNEDTTQLPPEETTLPPSNAGFPSRKVTELEDDFVTNFFHSSRSAKVMKFD